MSVSDRDAVNYQNNSRIMEIEQKNLTMLPCSSLPLSQRIKYFHWRKGHNTIHQE